MAPFTLAIHPNMLTVQEREVQVIAFESYIPKKTEAFTTEKLHIKYDSNFCQKG